VTFDWTRQTIKLLSKLQDSLSGTIQFWQRFNDDNGDIGYFVSGQSSAASQDRILLSLGAINKTFEMLQELQKILDRTSATCRDYANAVSLHEIIISP